MKFFNKLNGQGKILIISGQSLVVMILFLMIASCGSVSDRERISTDDINYKEKYHQLLVQNQELQKRLSMIEADQLSQWDVQEQEAVPAVASSSSPSASALSTTVDIFDRPQQDTSQRPVVAAGPVRHNYDDIDVEGQIRSLRQAMRLIDENQFEQATSLLQRLQSSQVRQIAVRAHFYQGEIFFRQGEYDLAMQAFERILRRDAFSGIVIKTLGRLIACSEQLNLDAKREQYHSLLNDFFET